MGVRAMSTLALGSEAGELISHTVGVVAFILFESKQWEYYQILLWVAAIITALEILSRVILTVRPFFQPIPPKGRHLDILTWTDVIFIWFNRLCTPIFTFQVLQFCWESTHVAWKLNEIGLLNTVGVLIPMFIIYDFFYTIFHRALHARSLYKHIHKHHHRQNVPTRGNVDAINVHPIEFVLGEYNHLLSLYIVSRLFSIHVVSAILFLLVGAVLASLNHTRFDVKVYSLFQVKYHDIHHWYPTANFGQYTMIWDHVFGWFRDYSSFDKTE